MEIYLKQGHTFPVPVTVADHLLGLASHDQLKVLLYLLCHADEPLSAEAVAKNCKVRPDAVEEAVAFWQDANVLSGSPELPAVRLQNTAPPQTVQPLQKPVSLPLQPAAEPKQEPVPEPERSKQVAVKAKLSIPPSEIAARIKENAAVAAVFQSIEQKIRRPLNYTEHNMLLCFHDYYGLEPDLILMLAFYCIQKNSFYMAYMEPIVQEWQTRGVMTHALAEEDIRRRTESDSFTGKIKRMFEMTRRPTKLQQSFIDRWQQQGWTLEMIQIAYEKTRNQADDKLNFKYINSILESWLKDGVRTVADAMKQDDAYYAGKQRRRSAAKKPPEGSANSSIDMDDLEKIMNPYGS